MSRPDLQKRLLDAVTADFAVVRDVFHLFPEDNMEKAFEVFEGKQISTLPVVNPYAPRKVLGVLKKDRLLLVYNEKILKTNVLRKISP